MNLCDEAKARGLDRPKSMEFRETIGEAIIQRGIGIIRGIEPYAATLRSDRMDNRGIVRGRPIPGTIVTNMDSQPIGITAEPIDYTDWAVGESIAPIEADIPILGADWANMEGVNTARIAPNHGYVDYLAANQPGPVPDDDGNIIADVFTGLEPNQTIYFSGATGSQFTIRLAGGTVIHATGFSIEQTRT